MNVMYAFISLLVELCIVNYILIVFQSEFSEYCLDRREHNLSVHNNKYMGCCTSKKK